MHETQADGADEIAAVLASGSRGDIVVLARTTILLRTIALGCSALGVRIAAPEQVFEPAGARGALEAYVRLCADPTDADAADVARVCRAPGRGLPLDAQEQVAASLRAGGSFTEGFATVAVAARQRSRLDEAGMTLDALARITDATRFVRYLRGPGGLDDYFGEHERAFGGTERIEVEVLEQASREASGRPSPNTGRCCKSRSEALAAIRDDKHGIELTTIHRAKGCQWPEVHVFGCEEGQLPHARVLEVSPRNARLERASRPSAGSPRSSARQTSSTRDSAKRKRREASGVRLRLRAMPVRPGTLGDVRIADFDAYFSATTFSRGATYASEGRVLSLDWECDGDGCTLSASVIGHGAIYSTTAYFDDDGDGLEFVEGECSCPVGFNCKHVVATVLAASASSGKTIQARRAAELTAYRQSLEASTPEASTLGAPPSPPPPAPWDRPLRALLAARTPPATGNPLAIELRLISSRHSDHGALRVMARLMRPGARGGWVNGSLDWGGLDTWTVRDGGYREDHLSLVKELHAAFRTGHSYSSYLYGYHTDRSIDLSAFDSPQLWLLLDKAARLGLPLIHAHASLGELQRPDAGELVLDVTRQGPERFGVGVSLRVGGAPAEPLIPLGFIGRPGHGLVCAERADVEARLNPERWRIRLVRLERPAVAQLERMLLDVEPIAIPAGELDRFASELCPGLRHVAPVVSSDGSFRPPTVSAPSLVLRTEHGPETLVTVGWEWEYEVGDSVHRVPLHDHDDAQGIRDHAAEQAQLAEFVLDEPGLQSHSLLDLTGRPATRPPAILSGLDSLRFVTEVLPRLSERPEVRLKVLGEPPDYRDVGESLEVGVSTGEIAGERDWFDLGVTIRLEGRELPFVEVFTALVRGESRMLLDDGAHFSLSDPRLESLRRLIDEARALSDSSASSLRISRYQADLWSELAALGVVTEQADRWQRIVAPLLELDRLPEHETPASLQAHLRPYQREGFAWLTTLWDLELGGILADDMGLGKTVQALALICHARDRNHAVGPFLVVAPTSVAPNWGAEAARFAPELNVEVVLDTLARSGRAIEEIATADVVITTYTLFRLDSDAYGSIPWAALVLDEAQYVKNHRGKTYRCARELGAPFKLAITGTPMENNLMELWALLSITAPGLFPDPVRFAEHYARPIERRSDGERMRRLRRRIKPLLKRRTKELVAAELPPKQEQTLEVELHPRHRKLYDTYLQRERQKVLRLLDDFDRNRFTILQSITRMRQLSLHPALVDARRSDLPCAKLDALVEQLDDVISSGHRALVFSQFTGFLSHVRARFDREGIGYCYLDGRTRRRNEVLQGFRDGSDPVFLISLKAGGVGLNLAEADYCFLLDPWWNPAVETQAIDRAHRIGQTRPVMVYRLIARDTIEQKVRALAELKAELFRGVIGEGELFAGGVTAEDIRELLA